MVRRLYEMRSFFYSSLNSADQKDIPSFVRRLIRFDRFATKETINDMVQVLTSQQTESIRASAACAISRLVRHFGDSVTSILFERLGSKGLCRFVTDPSPKICQV